MGKIIVFPLVVIFLALGFDNPCDVCNLPKPDPGGSFKDMKDIIFRESRRTYPTWKFHFSIRVRMNNLGCRAGTVLTEQT